MADGDPTPRALVLLRMRGWVAEGDVVGVPWAAPPHRGAVGVCQEMLPPHGDNWSIKREVFHRTTGQ